MINKRNALKLIIAVIPRDKFAPSDQTKRDINAAINPIIESLKAVKGYDQLGDVRQACVVALEYLEIDAKDFVEMDIDKAHKKIAALKLPGAKVIACQWRRNRPTTKTCGCGG